MSCEADMKSRAVPEVVGKIAKPSSPLPFSVPNDLFDYWVDAWQRSILLLDVLRQRGNNSIEHNARKVPNVLSFEAERVLDGRTLPRPVNYGLVRIVPPAGAAVDPNKRPFIVFDPRAGHGPGIGGMKHRQRNRRCPQSRPPLLFRRLSARSGARSDDRGRMRGGSTLCRGGR